MSNKKGDLIAKQRKTNLAGDDEEDTDCLQLDVKRIDRTLDDGRLQDRCIDIFFQVLDAENITMGKFLTCLVRKVTAAVDTVNEKKNIQNNYNHLYLKQCLMTLIKFQL
jgi:hypothetical protein